MRNRPDLVLVVAATLVWGACGGGSGGKDQSTAKDAAVTDSKADVGKDLPTTNEIPLDTAVDAGKDSSAEVFVDVALDMGGDTSADGYAFATCVELNECTESCSGEECVDECVAKASPQAVADLQALDDCLKQACPMCADQSKQNECDVCKQNAILFGDCEAENDKCMKFGEKPCSQVLTCMITCKGEDCLDKCASQASKKGLQLLVKLGQCLSQQCTNLDNPQDPCIQQALQGACKEEYQACLAG